MPLYMSNEALRFKISIINNGTENARLKNKYDSMVQVCHSHYRSCDAFSLHITCVDHVFFIILILFSEIELILLDSCELS